MNAVTAGRPFCFMVQFWGRRYRDYFVDFCLPSLLAPGNLPLLRAQDGHRLLIATPREDWDSIEHLPVMQRVREHATPTLIEVPAPSDNAYVSILRHQTLSLKRLFEAAYAYQAFGSAVWPDTILSDGMVAALLRSVAAGHHLVMQPTIRLAEEGVLGDLTAMGLLAPGSRLSMTGEALVVPPRTVADLSARHLHPEVLIFAEGHPCQPPHPPYRFWRVPDRRGIILHVFFATPVLMDFAVVPPDHAACLDEADWESVYVGRNFSHCGGRHVISDSDECGILSITPAAVDRSEPHPTVRFGARWTPTFALLCNLRESIAAYTRPRRDAARRDLFRVSVRWHADDVDEVWIEEERRIARFIDRAAGDYYADAGRFPPRISFDPRYVLLDLVSRRHGVIRFAAYVRTILRALAGDREDAARIGQRVSLLRKKLSTETAAKIRRARYWITSGGQRLLLIDPAELSFTDTRGRHRVNARLFAPDPETAIILAFGQSNIANEGDPNGLYEPGPGVYNFNFMNGRCYVARDPLLGTTLKRGNFVTRLGDLLVRRQLFKRVLLVPIGHGGTYMAEWAPGGRIHPRLLFALSQLKARNITVTHAIWQQGEAEASQPDVDAANWVQHFQAMTDALRSNGMAAPIHVAQCTESGHGPNESLRAAQRAVAAPTRGIFHGPDTDVIGPDERWDRCHFSAAGLQKAAELWFASLCSEVSMTSEVAPRTGEACRETEDELR